MQALGFLGELRREIRWRWVGFFAGTFAAWTLLFVMQPDLSVPEGVETFGLDYLIAICRTDARDASFPVLFAMWGLMSAAMMAPTAIPTFKAYDDLTHTEAADGVGFLLLVCGYLLVWSGFSGLAAGLQILLADVGALNQEGRSVMPWLNAALLLVAGLYQFSSLKQACLNKCRSPMMFFMNDWKEGRSGALQMGLNLGRICIGCCWALMLLAFVGGVMSLVWMGVAMVLMACEKLPAIGRYVTKPLGGILLLGSVVMTAQALQIL